MRKVKMLCILGLVIAFAIVFTIVPGCAKTEEAPAEEAAEVAEEAPAEEAPAVPEGGFVVAVSNSFITHSWRTQMVNNLQKAVEYYKGQGLVKEFLLQHSGADLDLQTTQFQNFINLKPDLIIIDPLSSTALNPVIEDAIDQGILVIVSDEPVTSEIPYQVMPSHDIWMYKLAKYVFDRLDGEGKVVYLSGIDGAPASDMRDDGFYRALDEYPDIELLTQAFGSWDPALAQQAMTDILAAYPEIDGVVAHDGQCLSVIQAFEAAGRGMPIVNGSGFRPFFEYWVEELPNGFTSYAIANGPGFAMTASMGIGIRLLMGEEFKEDVLPPGEKYFSIDHTNIVTDENVEEVLAEHVRLRGVEDYIDEVWTQERLDALFK